MVAALLAVLVVLLIGGAAGVVLMRRHADPRRALTSGPSRSIDPFAVNEPWRRFVQDALRAQSHFAEAVAGAKAGPLRDRLLEIGRSLDGGVQTTWATAQQGQTLREARRRIDTNQVSRRLQSFRASDDANAAKAVASLEAQLASAERLDRVTSEAESKLRLLQAQLDEAVARAAELSVQAGDIGALAGVEDDITDVTDQMEALRLALEETSRGGFSEGPGPGDEGAIPQADH